MFNWTINDQFIDDLKIYYTEFIQIKQNKVQNLRKKERIIKIDFKQLMNQLIVRIINHKKNRFKSNLKTLKNENNSDLKSDAKNNSNSNSNFNFKKLRSDKEKKKTYISFDFSKICSYCHKKNHEELHCKLKNWKAQSDKWKKFNEQKIHYHKEVHKIKNRTKNKMKKNDEKIIYFNNLNKDLSTKILNVSYLISNVWAVNSDWYIDSKSSFHSIYNHNAFMIFLQLSEFKISENAKNMWENKQTSWKLQKLNKESIIKS